MKRITFSADESLIDNARREAEAQNATLNAAFREWLNDFTGRSVRVGNFAALMERLKYVRVDRTYSRDEMNQR